MAAATAETTAAAEVARSWQILQQQQMQNMQQQHQQHFYSQ